jgi:hypothetical protein
MGLDEPNNDIAALIPEAVSLLEHGECLTYTRSGSQKDP